jgi:hypothetical protein
VCIRVSGARADARVSPSQIVAPAHGSLGACGRREFEFVHLRPDPIDESDIALASMRGALGTIGIPFGSWSGTAGITADDGAIFWSNPELGPANPQNAAHVTGIQVMQITVRNGALWDARLNFQGRTEDGSCNSANDHDSHDSCMAHDWEERHVTFSNRPGMMKRTSGTYHFLTPSIAIVAGPTHAQNTGIAGYTTYKCIVQLKNGNDARNVYAIFGDAADPLILPPAYQVTQSGFGADIGGTHHSLWTLMPEAQFDSYLTLGTIDMDHPDILDNLHMLAHGSTCDLACDTGYAVRGIQPNCNAGVLTESVTCVATGNVSPSPPPSPDEHNGVHGRPNPGDVGVPGGSGADPPPDLTAVPPPSPASATDDADSTLPLKIAVGVIGSALVVGAGMVGYKIQSHAGRARVMDGKVAEADVFHHAGRCSGVPQQAQTGGTTAEDNAVRSRHPITMSY